MTTCVRSAIDAPLTDGAAMRQLEAHAGALDGDRLRQLDSEGYVIIPDAIGAAWLERLRARVEVLRANEGSGGGHENAVRHEACALADLVNKGEVFDGIWNHPLVLAAASHLICAPFRLMVLNLRVPKPGEGLQAVHRDTGGRRTKLQAIFLLDDFTPDNGSTRVIPRSHLQPQHAVPTDGPAAFHPGEVTLCAPAGSLLLYEGHLLHSGTLNRSGAPRRTLILAYVPRSYPQQCNQAECLRVSTAKRLDPLQRWLLDA